MSAPRPILRWKKSTFSSDNGSCVEVAVLPAGANWHKSSYSANNGNCVEVATVADRRATRDSKNPDGPTLTFPTESFTALLHHLT